MSDYQSQTHRDTSALKRWTHERRFHDALGFLHPTASETILDYGCGDGHFLSLCRRCVPDDRLVGYDPLANMATQARRRLNETQIRITENIRELSSSSFDTIFCLETLEHLVPSDIDQVIRNMKTLLKPSGRLIVSVPVEIGPVSLLKNIFRKIRRPTYENWTWRNVLQATTGQPPSRSINMALGYPYIFSHIGFDHRALQKILAEHFVIEQTQYSPFPLLGAAANATVYLVMRHRR